MSKTDFNIELAPMEGVTEFPTRLWLSLFGNIRAMTTPFYRVTQNHNAEIPLSWAPEIFIKDIGDRLSYSLTPQLMAASISDCKKVAKKLTSYSPKKIELNCGCPSPRAVGRGAGSSLLKDVGFFREFIEELMLTVGANKLSVKMRTGYENELLFEELIDRIFHLPLNRVVIHGRTKEQGYKGLANWELIEYAAKLMTIPVFGSGDIVDSKSFEDRCNISPSIKGVLIGRGALFNPLIFNDLRTLKKIHLTPGLILYALKAHALLLDLFREDLPSLIEMVREGFFDYELHSETSWNNFYEKAKFFVDKKENNIEINKIIVSKNSFSLGRTKLMWARIKYNLSKNYHDRRFLRASTLNEFFNLIEEEIRL